MRLITLDEAVDITCEMFDRYVEPVGISLMSGEVPSVMFAIHRSGTKEKDWLSQVRFKNTLTISLFRCDVYLDDVFRLCRRCRLYLITREVYAVTALYSMLHPLYQSQYMDFTRTINEDYDSMMAGAGRETKNFIESNYRFSDPLENVVLRILDRHMATFTNRGTEKFDGKTPNDYEEVMMQRYPEAYRVARYRKAQTTLIDAEGFMVLERTERSE